MNKKNDDIKKIIKELQLNNVFDETKLNDKNETLLTRYELECMIPDYIFDKLSEDERARFEGVVVNFPDLEEEIDDAKELFAQLDKFDYQSLIKDKSQYLPSRVAANLEQQGKLHTEWQPNKKRLVGFGVLSVALLAILYFNNSYFNTEQEIMQPLQAELTATTAHFTDLEKEFLAEEIIEDDFVEMLGYTPYYATSIDHDLYSLFIDVDANYYDMMYADFENYNEIDAVMLSVPDYDYDMLIRWAASADESTFQDLLDDIYDS